MSGIAARRRVAWAFAALLGSCFVAPVFFATAAEPTAADPDRIRASIREALAAAEGGAGSRPPEPIGVRGEIGPKGEPTRASRLVVRESGVYENYLIDGGWKEQRLVRISADAVVLRNCEIRNGLNNAVEVYGDDVLIENCRIHHVLRGTFAKQADAHGVTGRPRRLVVRNCEIYQVSGDALQFDPGRDAWGDVLIENCELWTGPLTEDAAGFRRGERPGENAVDTKTDPKNPPARLVIRNCFLHGWGDGQISVQAALNLKERLNALVENCAFRDNDVCFRLRGDTGRGNADV
ncbi:MAG TPA: right-handed parallel beta-helix repeat-containing protein, partial [Planctomycetaceae bacterium]